MSLPISIHYQAGDTIHYPSISLPVGDVDNQAVKVAGAARWVTLHYAGLRGEGSIPVPLPLAKRTKISGLRRTHRVFQSAFCFAVRFWTEETPLTQKGTLTERHYSQHTHIAKRMCDAGMALAVMGDHEFNALAWAEPDGNGGFLRPHTQQTKSSIKNFSTRLVRARRLTRKR
jgi:hypothetical protein